MLKIEPYRPLCQHHFSFRSRGNVYYTKDRKKNLS